MTQGHITSYQQVDSQNLDFLTSRIGRKNEGHVIKNNVTESGSEHGSTVSLLSLPLLLRDIQYYSLSLRALRIFNHLLYSFSQNN